MSSKLTPRPVIRKKKPKYVIREITRHGDVVWYFRRGKGMRTRLPPIENSSEFSRAYTAALRNSPVPQPPKPRTAFHVRQKQYVETQLKRAVMKSRARAKHKNLDFDISFAWALNEVIENDYRCALTNIPFYLKNSSLSSVDPFIPSLDRIDNSKGYTTENTRVVVFAINAMLLDWGEEIFEEVANKYRYKKIKDRSNTPLTFSR